MTKTNGSSTQVQGNETKPIQHLRGKVVSSEQKTDYIPESIARHMYIWFPNECDRLPP